MPYKSEKIKLPRELDRRVKLTEEDKEIIRKLYKEERKGVREIARMYEHKCSRRLIQFVIFPERAEVAKRRMKEHWREYSVVHKKKRKEAQKSLRRRKHELYKKGKLKWYGLGLRSLFIPYYLKELEVVVECASIPVDMCLLY